MSYLSPVVLANHLVRVINGEFELVEPRLGILDIIIIEVEHHSVYSHRARPKLFHRVLEGTVGLTTGSNIPAILAPTPASRQGQNVLLKRKQLKQERPQNIRPDRGNLR